MRILSVNIVRILSVNVRILSFNVLRILSVNLARIMSVDVVRILSVNVVRILLRIFSADIAYIERILTPIIQIIQKYNILKIFYKINLFL